MEDEEIYNALIIALVIGIIIVIISLIVFRPEKESFTQLYFNNHKELPEYSQDSYKFSFTIDNHENKEYIYNYVVKLIENNKEIVLEENQITLKDKEKNEINKELKFDVENKAMLQVSLKDKNQEIHFWIKNKDKWLEYQDIGDASIECLPTYEGTLLYFEAQGSEADGLPILEIRIDGILIDSLNVDKISEKINLEPNLIVDLTFTNDFNIKDENGTIIKDRNIIFNKLKLNNVDINPVYDRGSNLEAFDCLNTITGLRMAWSGSLRFRTK